MRLDVFLFENSLAKSRTEAKNLILSGYVKLSGGVVTKPSYEISETETDIVVEAPAKKYAGRGGFKLECALSSFDISVTEKLAVDIGASTGGFTDCLLQNGAKHVISIDSGSGQLVDCLREDTRVTVIENYNARYLKSDDLIYVPNLAVMDVSFISSTYIIPSVYNILSEGGDFICLIKPQFEVGRGGLAKGGIVKNEKIRNEAVERVIKFAKSCGFSFIDVIQSSLAGGDGNIEYLAHFRKCIV